MIGMTLLELLDVLKPEVTIVVFEPLTDELFSYSTVGGYFPSLNSEYNDWRVVQVEIEDNCEWKILWIGIEKPEGE